jgi:hypothetical protein
MSMRWKVLISVVLLAIGWWVFGLVRDYADPTSIPHEAIRYWIKAYAESYYEFHAKTGRWPTSLDDLGQTTLPVRYPLWRSSPDLQVFLWPQDLKDDPKENASRILVYYRKGLISEMGRKWVCFGDLRTEFVKDKDLEALLNASKASRP